MSILSSEQAALIDRVNTGSVSRLREQVMVEVFGRHPPSLSTCLKKRTGLGPPPLDWKLQQTSEIPANTLLCQEIWILSRAVRDPLL